MNHLKHFNNNFYFAAPFMGMLPIIFDTIYELIILGY